jgi:hypothetical protein
MVCDLDPTGQTTYDFKKMFHVKLLVKEPPRMFDPKGKYCVASTVNFLRQVDLNTQEHAAKACSTIAADYNRLHKNDDVMFKD